MFRLGANKKVTKCDGYTYEEGNSLKLIAGKGKFDIVEKFEYSIMSASTENKKA